MDMNAIAVANPSLAGRVNWRALIFIGGLLLLLGWPAYTFLDEWWTGGVHDRGSYKQVNLKAMGFFQFTRDAPTTRDVPTQFRALDGQKVLLNGIVEPMTQAGDQISEFTLIYSPISCCIGAGLPLVQERVFATARGGKSLAYARAGRHDVFGTLHVNVKTDETGHVIEVYRLDADWVKAAD
jgi:hypothetical protein